MFRIDGLVAVILILAAPGAVSPPATAADRQRALRNTFAVTADNCDTDLGTFSSVTGLNVSWDVADYQSGGLSSSNRRYFPDTLHDGTVTLRRRAGSDSAVLQEWLRRVSDSHEPSKIAITFVDADDQPVISWELHRVLPQKWTGPDLDADSSDVAMETLVLSHEGFSLVRPGRLCRATSHDHEEPGPQLGG